MWFWLILLTGLALVIFVTVDILWSTISTQGGGPLTMAVMAGCWKLSRAVFRRMVRQHRVLEVNALLTLVATFLIWVVLLWLGWTLVFSAGQDVIVYSTNQEPTTVVDRFYFSGMALWTLGTGDLVADGPGWRMASMVAAFNGLVVITLTITYLNSVISAAIEKRKLALSIDALGETARDMLEVSWDGRGFAALNAELRAIADELTLHAERHLAYPVLQYFHSRDAGESLPVSVAKLDDATTLLSRCLTEEAEYNRPTIRSLRSAVDLYIERVQLSHVSTVEKPPPMPDFEALRETGMTLRSYRTCREAFAKRTDLRRTLSGMINSEGWEWPG